MGASTAVPGPSCHWRVSGAALECITDRFHSRGESHWRGRENVLWRASRDEPLSVRDAVRGVVDCAGIGCARLGDVQPDVDPTLRTAQQSRTTAGGDDSRRIGDSDMSQHTNGAVTHLGNHAAVPRILLRLKPDRRQIRLGGHRRSTDVNRRSRQLLSAVALSCVYGIVLALASQR
jgi:hypothetical protein